MADCNHDCSNCNQDCSERSQSLKVSTNDATNIKKTIAIVSGKGGVGKSLVTSLCAVSSLRSGKNVGILDADVTGPSIPKMFGVHDRLEGDGTYIFPSISKGGVKMVSANLMMDDETEPILWRGPLIAGMVKQFYSDVAYGDLDYLYIDMPPGTGDVSLTVFQSLNVDGIIIVTTPQDLVSMIVEKAIKMANMMNIKVLGIIENMSYVVCPNCKEHIEIFGHSHLEEVAKKYNLDILGRIPINQEFALLSDKGEIEKVTNTYLDNLKL